MKTKSSPLRTNLFLSASLLFFGVQQSAAAPNPLPSSQPTSSPTSSPASCGVLLSEKTDLVLDLRPYFPQVATKSIIKLSANGERLTSFTWKENDKYFVHYYDFKNLQFFKAETTNPLGARRLSASCSDICSLDANKAEQAINEMSYYPSIVSNPDPNVPSYIFREKVLKAIENAKLFVAALPGRAQSLNLIKKGELYGNVYLTSYFGCQNLQEIFVVSDYEKKVLVNLYFKEKSLTFSTLDGGAKTRVTLQSDPAQFWKYFGIAQAVVDQIYAQKSNALMAQAFPQEAKLAKQSFENMKKFKTSFLVR